MTTILRNFIKTFLAALLITLAIVGSAKAEEQRTREQVLAECKKNGAVLELPDGTVLGDPDLLARRQQRIENTIIRADGTQEYFPQGRENALKEHQTHVQAVAEQRRLLKEASKGVNPDEPNGQSRSDEAIKQVKNLEKEDAEKDVARENEIKNAPLAEINAKNQAAFNKAGLTPWEEFTTKDKTK